MVDFIKDSLAAQKRRKLESRMRQRQAKKDKAKQLSSSSFKTGSRKKITFKDSQNCMKLTDFGGEDNEND